MTLETIELTSKVPPTASVIWMHGLGADGNDFVPIVGELDLAGVAPLRFVFPHAPIMPVTINGGYRMRAWYDVLGMDLVQREDEAGLRASQVQVEALIAREKTRGIAAQRIVLAGFSQGCAMTLLTGLRHGERLAGLLGLSGYLPIASSTATEASAINRDVPIFLAHGTLDPVIAINRARESRDALIKLGYAPEWHEYAMPHAVAPEEVVDIAHWLRKVLPA